MLWVGVLHNLCERVDATKITANAPRIEWHRMGSMVGNINWHKSNLCTDAPVAYTQSQKQKQMVVCGGAVDVRD